MRMRLPGRLNATTVGDLFGALYRDRITGTLELIQIGGVFPGRVHAVHLRHGLVQRVDAPGRDLAALLLEQPSVGARTLEEIARHRRAVPGGTDRDLIGHLVSTGAAPTNLIAATVRAQMRERLEALFKLPDAAVRFRVAIRPPLSEETVPLGPSEFLHGRRRFRQTRGAEDSGAGARRRRLTTRDRALTVLGLDPGAGPSAVQRAFRALAGRLHPDRYPCENELERKQRVQRFAEVSAAYHALVG